MTPIVLKCGDAPLPLALRSLDLFNVPGLPEKDHFADAFAKLETVEKPRLVVVGGDAAFAATLTRLMRTDRLHIELAYVPEERTDATHAYGLRTGSKAAAIAVSGTARPMPLIRDDAGIALVGEARIYGSEHAGELTGEAYVDNDRLFSGTVPGMRIVPIPELPGLRAAVDKRRWFGGHRWLTGRAVQLGSPSAVLTRDGVRTPRAVKRSTFYRHDQDWLLVYGA
ncbi:hypothetical protein M2284_001628 [Rhodococcus sp. LBL1]|uniref:DAGKc domain-containing protein n=1 Tax=Prescottella agglutinans TaxID=1644129 RepID=A0ABT6M8H3_9NOCA|nr:hypothetical protein [Prescottella agglutinans]MDH6280606.1 hypothetical protein [Prescottella agglutinans]MDH6677430.1 hypothetical protein [Rhodococcus sp. LBL1]MDH6682276.1 hypothetical protein [Rhodococcus sp. LBL2]